MKNISIVYAANGKNGYLVLKEILKLNISIEYLIVQERVGSDDVLKMKKIAGLTRNRIIIWNKSDYSLLEKNLSKKKSKILFSVNFGYRIPVQILRLFELPINLHMSYLPYNKGAFPNVWSILNNTPAGVSIHIMSDKFDEGPIIFQKRVPVTLFDTGKTLYNKLIKASVKLVKERFRDIVLGLYQVKDNIEGDYHSEKDFKEVLEINPNKTYTAIDFINLLRACSFPPYRNLYINHNGERIYLELKMYKEKK